MDGPFALDDPKALHVLLTRELPPLIQAPLIDAYTVHPLYERAERLAWLAKHGAAIEAVVTSGMIGLSDEEMALMPNLRIVQTFAVGYESVDVAAARARGVMVCNAGGANAFCVAEHAIGLMIALTRGFVPSDRAARTEPWESSASRDWPTVTGKRLGIIGLGHIGGELARRAAAFDMEIGYHNRRRRADRPERYFDGVAALAEWADYLVASCPGGPATHHIVDRPVLDRLGPRGYAVNVARGTVFDTAALAAALAEGAIAGAALDVVEDEDHIPAALLAAPNLLLTPHIAGRAPETQVRRISLIRANIENHLTGRPVLTPVPEMAG